MNSGYYTGGGCGVGVLGGGRCGAYCCRGVRGGDLV